MEKSNMVIHDSRITLADLGKNEINKLAKIYTKIISL